MSKQLAGQLLDFIHASPSVYHAVATIVRELAQAGYTPLHEATPWQLAAGGKYYVVRGESSVIAFQIPQAEAAGFMIAAVHSDSPALKIRQNAEVVSAAANSTQLSVEPYGGFIYYSWMDRPLSVAGRIAYTEGASICSRLVNVDRDLLVIPSTAIHLNRSVNDGVALKPNVDLLPLFATGTEMGRFMALVAQTVGVEEADILSTELFLYPRTPGALLGQAGEFVASAKLDDLQCAFACLHGFLQAQPGGSIPVLCVFNNEEVGSGTYQGAASSFLKDVLHRICEGRGDACHTAIANSFMVSADNAHAVHPNHAEFADKVEAPVLNGGIVIKHNASQKYATDAVSSAVFRRICKEAGAPVQLYSNRADLPGGSTLGNISSAQVSIPTVDIGLPQLGMHAAYEVAGVQDTAALVAAMTAYFARSFRVLPNGEFRI